MKTNLHIIQKQAVHLTVSRRENALALQQRFERMLEEQLLPRLEPVFDRLAGPDVWVELDKLEIPVGGLDPQGSEADWLGKIFRAYVTALEENIQKPATVKRSAPSKNLEEVLAYFLKRGYLPWWVGNFDLETAIQKAIPAQAVQIFQLLQSPAAIQRWARQFGRATQEALFSAITAQGSLSVKKSPMDTGIGRPKQEALFLGLATQSPLSMKKLPQHTGIRLIGLEAWQAFFPELPQHKVQYIYWEAVWEALQSPPEFTTWLSLLIRHTLAALPGSAAKAKIRQIIKKKLQVSEKVKTQLLEELSGQPPFSLKREIEDQAPVRRRPVQEPEGIFVLLAGIVLIHPFLPAFYERLGLMEGGQFRDASCQERAVHLLYFLATGLQHPGEQEVMVMKILCGIELETPIARGIDLTEPEKAEAVQLLQALVSQWQAVEGSSPDDIRGAFFVREGKLQYGEMGWHLTVEVQAYDILLTKLSWGLSPIMHSWMKEMIWVDWG